MSKLIIEAKDLTRLPRVSDSISYLYVEHCIIEQDNFSVVAIDEEGRTPIPIACITTLMVGPGTTITHAAIRTIAECGCLLVWCGEDLRKFYAYGSGETRSSKNLQKQMHRWFENRLEVVRRMYAIRFPKTKTEGMSLEKLRGMEGARVKKSYQVASKMYGIRWHGRKYKIDDIDDSDGINRALTLAYDYLYAVCEAAIVSVGYSPAIGFIHTGTMRSFVYDIADLYKADVSIPAAFESVKNEPWQIDKEVRRCCRKRFVQIGLMERIIKDIDEIFNIDTPIVYEDGLWNEGDVVAYGKNYDGSNSGRSGEQY